MMQHKIATLGVLLLLSGCASYQAQTLSMLPEPTLETVVASADNNVLFSWKPFDRQESETYLGRDVLDEGIVPVQLTIRNNSKDPVYLSPNNFSVPLVPVNQVAEKVHTSTAGRVVGYGVPGLFLWPFLIPAVYDGMRSSAANDALDADYATKAVKEQTIQPRSSFNGIIFVAKEHISKPIEMFLVNQNTQERIPYTGLAN